MYGAILGDIIGSPYEFDMGGKTKDFPLFDRSCAFTDDSVMTIAVAEALMDSMGKGEAEHKAALVASMQKWGRWYPSAGYGTLFDRWLYTENPQPYGSYGNGSAMRVSAAGWLYDTLEETLEKAKWTSEVTHDHPAAIIGAQATAAAIFLARTGRTKEEIREYIVSEFRYDLSRTCDEIRPGYHHVELCEETVPEAITAFLEGTGFTDVIRTAVSLGGDCDTLTCIAGSMAEAYYGVPERLQQECCVFLTREMAEVLFRLIGMRSRLYISYQRDELERIRVSEELRAGDPERAGRLEELLRFAIRFPGKKEEHEKTMQELRRAFAAGELCPKSEEEYLRDTEDDDMVCGPVRWHRGESATEKALADGLITEEDLEDE